MQAISHFPFKLSLAPALLLTLCSFVHADDWPQWLGPQRDAIWRETGILDKFPGGGPKVRWRTPIGSGYSGPAVAKGHVYVTDRILAEGTKQPDNPFRKPPVAGKERILCLSEKNGELLWKHEYDCTYRISYADGPRATPLVQDGRVYSLGAMGNLLCLNADDGKVIWSKDFVKDCKAPVPLWGFAAHPLLDGDKLICLVGGKDHLVVAFDKNTGAEKWHALSFKKGNTEIGYSPPMIYTLGGKRQLIIWHPESVNGLDPETGELYWSQPFAVKANLTAPTPRQAGDLLFVTSFYNGAMMLKFMDGKPTVLWRSEVASEDPRRTDTLNSIIPTPMLRDGHIYGVCSYGELRCLRASDGKRLWMSLKATEVSDERVRWANAFLIAQGDRFFLPNEKGDLIIARLMPKGYEEIDRAHILEPTDSSPGRLVVWSHPAFANKSMYARNDKEIVCVSLAAK
ncbi:MAG TPA: PQQ-binding-like beta-propeller repeat protein [Gemmataceae bacterium]|nr:PQQ-binding-like beta-propeller repeat protein [Gemmataceae bacterium]